MIGYTEINPFALYDKKIWQIKTKHKSQQQLFY